MISKNLFLFFALFFAQVLFAQQWHWAKSIPLFGFNNHSAIHPNGTLYIACGAAFYEVSANGDTIAANNYSGPGLQIKALQINTKGNLVIGGYVSDSFTLAGQTWSNTGNYQDIFIAELNTQYQQVWSHVIGGSDHQNITDLGVDKNDNVYCTGIIRSNFNFLGKQLKGKTPGTSFVAKLNPVGKPDWAFSDSCDKYSAGTRISVNANGESLTSIESSGCSYFYFNQSQFYPSTGLYYYGDQFALLLKSDGSVIHARSDKNSKSTEYYFTGLNSATFHRVGKGFWNGDRFSDIQEYDFKGDITGGYNGGILDPDDNYTAFLGVIDDKPYFLCSRSYYDQTGEKFEHYVSVFEQHQMKNLIGFSGQVNTCRLHKRSDGTFVLDGAYEGKLTFENLKLTSKIFAVNGNDTIYDWHTFVAAFNPDTKTAVVENQFQKKISLFPNPVKDKLYLSGSVDMMRGQIINSLGQVKGCFASENEIDLSHLATGIYFLRLYSDGRVWTEKFVKE